VSTSKIDSKDEIGGMLASMNQLADDLQNVVIGTMNQIAAGGVSTNIEVRDPEDEIARASEIVSVNRVNQLARTFYSRTPDKKGCRLKNLSWI